MNDYSGVPSYMWEGIRNYVNQRIAPGSFLRAVLENNFVKLADLADEDNFRCLPQWANLLYNEIPLVCWGSPEKVRAWIGKEEVLHDKERKTKGL